MKKEKEKKKNKKTAPKTPSKAKQAVKNTGSKIKSGIKKTGEKLKKAKNDVKEWKGKCKVAYNEGFNAGLQAYENIPKGFATKTCAKAGFNKSINQRSKQDKLVENAEKQKAIQRERMKAQRSGT